MDTRKGPNILIETLTHGTVTLTEARKSFYVGNIIERFGQWAVTPHGIECLVTPYAIKRDRLDETDWVSHMTQKQWVVDEEFKAAYAFAIQHHKASAAA